MEFIFADELPRHEDIHPLPLLLGLLFRKHVLKDTVLEIALCDVTKGVFQHPRPAVRSILWDRLTASLFFNSNKASVLAGS